MKTLAPPSQPVLGDIVGPLKYDPKTKQYSLSSADISRVTETMSAMDADGCEIRRVESKSKKVTEETGELYQGRSQWCRCQQSCSAAQQRQAKRDEGEQQPRQALSEQIFGILRF